MSNVDNQGLRTLDQVRAERFHAEMAVRPPGDTRTGREQITRLNPGELQEIEQAAKRGFWANPGEALAMVNTINSLSRRIAVRFNETAQARQAVQDLCQETASLRTQLEARGPMADLGQLVDAVAGRERAERRAAVEAQARNHATGELMKAERRIRDLVEDRNHAVGQLQTQLKDARVQLANLRQELEARYTKAQVAELQASEAELVSRPLKARITELEARIYEMVAEIQDANRRRRAANNRAARHMRNLEKESRLGQDLYPQLKSRETEIELLETALKDWKQAGQKIADAVFSEETTAALDQVHPGSGPLAHLVEVVRAVRGAMLAYRPKREVPLDGPAEPC